MHVNATPAAVKASNLKSKVLGSFSFDRDPTERSNRLASLKAFLPSEKARDDLVSHLKLYQGTTTMKPEEVNPTVSESTRLVTIKLLHGELSFSHIVSFLSGLGCSSDAMYFLSNDVLRIRLPLDDDVTSFTTKCRAVNLSLGKAFLRLLQGETGTVNLEFFLGVDQALAADQRPPVPRPFLVQGHTADLDAESILTFVEDSGGA